MGGRVRGRNLRCEDEPPGAGQSLIPALDNSNFSGVSFVLFARNRTCAQCGCIYQRRGFGVPALSQVGYISVCVSYLREASEDRVSTAEVVEACVRLRVCVFVC